MNPMFETQCPGCGQEIDIHTCWCGEERADKQGHLLAHEGHPFIPAGCDCYRAPSPPSDYRAISRPKARFEPEVLSALALVDQAIPECLRSPRDGDFDPRYFRDYELRERYCKINSWAVPCSAAIARILDLGPIVEMGAGTGYWAKWITECGGDIVAYDEKPHRGNHWCDPSAKHFKVKKGSFEKLSDYSNRTRTLFLCWPPYDTSFAADCLKAYRGDTLVFVGEGSGGCTGDDAFFNMLDGKSWVESGETVRIPQWYGIHDYLFVYRRAAPPWKV